MTISSARLPLTFILIATLLPHPAALTNPAPTDQPALVHTCLITRDIRQLAAFYTKVLRIQPNWSGEDYVEFRGNVGTLAIFSYSAQQQYIPNVTEPASNRSVILEFRVSDVDAEYAGLQQFVKSWVKPPTTQPWGTRSIYFRDPDGNLVDFFTEPKNRQP